MTSYYTMPGRSCGSRSRNYRKPWTSLAPANRSNTLIISPGEDPAEDVEARRCREFLDEYDPARGRGPRAGLTWRADQSDALLIAVNPERTRKEAR
ncbi:MAG: hypothetical protein ACRDQ4_10105 [Pseudonocardiaceae bacterium]